MTGPIEGALGRHLSKLLGDVIVHAHGSVADQTAQARTRAGHDFMEHTESEMAPILQGLFEHMLASEQLPPGLRTVLDEVTEPQHQAGLLLQIVTGASAILALVMSLGPIEIQKYKNELYGSFQDVPLAAPDLADMVERSVLTLEAAQAEATLTGVNAERFGLMYLNAGEPPGVVDMLGLWRRGLINDAQLEAGIGFSRIRNDYTPWLKLMAYQTMGAADAIEGVVKGVIDSDSGQQLFDEAGGLDSQFQVLLDTAGDAIGVEAAGNLFNHGLIDEGQLAQVILHSRINPIFEPMAELLRHKWLAPFQVSQALKAGAITAEQATQWLLQDGYPADQAAGMVAEGTGTKLAKAKELTESQIVEMRAVGLLTQPQATTELGLIGYNPTEAALILSLDDRKRALTIRNQELSVLRKSFLEYRMTDTDVSNELDSLGVDPTLKADYVKAWTVERKMLRRTLTLAEIGALLKKGGLTPTEAVARWEQLGFTSADADLLLLNYGGKNLTAAERAQIQGQS